MQIITSGWNAPDLDQRVQVFITRNIGLLLTDSVYGIKKILTKKIKCQVILILVVIVTSIGDSVVFPSVRKLSGAEAFCRKSGMSEEGGIRAGGGGWEMGEQPWQQRQSKLCAGTVHVWDSVMQHHIQSLSRVPWGFSRTAKEMLLNHMSYGKNWWKYSTCTAHLHCTIFLV